MATEMETTLSVRQVLDAMHQGSTTAAAIAERVRYAEHTVQAALDLLERNGVVIRRGDGYRINLFFRAYSTRWKIVRQSQDA